MDGKKESGHDKTKPSIVKKGSDKQEKEDTSPDPTQANVRPTGNRGKNPRLSVSRNKGTTKEKIPKMNPVIDNKHYSSFSNL
ncbi:hypothetical protein BB559_005732 [Furculomyces boomerangus]|uniref:Uncharacterized protein n=2 Tax=Harpellales TaxID=61421 RepID=A0A2T9Y6Z3_9FUNG|nr:hypothetical protein BB559_005732 [Furculomyces boomerangus]PVZ97693.1 hypothetical protein BB558_006340 [Smittium angustum]